ncbi:hypothetical protein GT352_28370 [Streptomyces sp. SID1046]|uniref:hypothetical protein n=1 Tax=Streptomyces sp. SID1046 TaxID=2690249 RepID=UPI00136B6075|nr:hypothetical protein [Streptomyces sp. SID1046]MYV77817.1 hypothetical protein [Streptomyces sp. SID1046]
MGLNSVTYNGTTTIAISSGLFTWTASDLTLRVRPNLTWTATRGDKSASGATAQDAVDNLAAAEAKAERAARLTARSTKGQFFAREMRTHLHIGARTRRFAKRWTADGHRDVMQAIADANNYRGSLNAEREAIFRTAFSALCSWEKHIDGYRTDAALISHINAMSPYQFVGLIGDMIDAGISNVGEGERFFAQMARRLYAQAA